jgi:hypothetical protein
MFLLSYYNTLLLFKILLVILFFQYTIISIFLNSCFLSLMRMIFIKYLSSLGLYWPSFLLIEL